MSNLTVGIKRRDKMSFGIGDRVEVITALYLGRWIYPFEKGVVEGRHCSPAGQEVNNVKLETDNTTYTFAPSEINEVESDIEL